MSNVLVHSAVHGSFFCINGFSLQFIKIVVNIIHYLALIINICLWCLLINYIVANSKPVKEQVSSDKSI